MLECDSRYAAQNCWCGGHIRTYFVRKCNNCFVERLSLIYKHIVETDTVLRTWESITNWTDGSFHSMRSRHGMTVSARRSGLVCFRGWNSATRERQNKLECIRIWWRSGRIRLLWNGKVVRVLGQRRSGLFQYSQTWIIHAFQSRSFLYRHTPT